MKHERDKKEKMLEDLRKENAQTRKALNLLDAEVAKKLEAMRIEEKGRLTSTRSFAPSMGVWSEITSEALGKLYDRFYAQGGSVKLEDLKPADYNLAKDICEVAVKSMATKPTA